YLLVVAAGKGEVEGEVVVEGKVEVLIPLHLVAVEHAFARLAEADEGVREVRLVEHRRVLAAGGEALFSLAPVGHEVQANVGVALQVHALARLVRPLAVGQEAALNQATQRVVVGAGEPVDLLGTEHGVSAALEVEAEHGIAVSGRAGAVVVGGLGVNVDDIPDARGADGDRGDTVNGL